MTDEERRQVLFAALVLHEPAAAPLRDRALDRIILAALLGSSPGQPYKFGSIVENLLQTPGIRVRDKYIHDSLDRLKAEGLLENGVEDRSKKTYLLSPAGAAHLDAAAGAGAALFERVLERVLRNTGALVEHEVARTIVRRFLSECFANFGRSIAHVVIGAVAEGDGGDHRVDTAAAFETAISGCSLSPAAHTSLRVRCEGLLTSTEPEDERLRFALTQGYYFAQLLGLDPEGFSPLTDEAFNGSTFFIDTNVIFVGLFSHGHASSAQIDELFLVAKRIGIDLRVTRATINEARRAAALRRIALSKLVDALPDVILQRARDPIVRAFLVARLDDPSVTVDRFLEPFEDLAAVLQRRWGITLDDVIEDEMLASDPLPKVEETFQRAAERTRPYPKREAALKHDVAHFAFVAKQRQSNPKTWFLTRDRSLVMAAAGLAKGGKPFCFSLAGFLQSISPFVETVEQAHSLADLFSAVITDQVFTRDALFETRELLVLAEMHEDVHASSPEQIVKAFDTVRITAERGREYTPAEKATIALALRKELAATSTSRHRGLADNIERLEREREGEKLNRQRAEAERDVLATEMESIRSQLSKTIDDKARLESEGVALRSAAREADFQGRLAIALLTSLAAMALWILDDRLARWLTTRWQSLPLERSTISFFISAIGLLSASLAILRLTALIERAHLRRAIQTLSLAGLVGVSGLLSDESASRVANLLEIAAIIALFVAAEERRWGSGAPR